MILTSLEIKAMVAGFFRYKVQCPVVAFEASNKLKWATGEPADILVVTKSRMLYEIEVKISISDLRGDRQKRKHSSFRNSPSYLPVHKYYFAVSNELSDKALDICNEIYPYAGLLEISKFPFNSAAVDFGVRVRKTPKCLNSARLPLKEVLFLVKEQSGTLCRLARENASLHRMEGGFKDEKDKNDD
jgi:hypothetical protein